VKARRTPAGAFFAKPDTPPCCGLHDRDARSYRFHFSLAQSRAHRTVAKVKMMRRHFRKSTLSMAAAQSLLLCAGTVMAQEAATPSGSAASAPSAAASQADKAEPVQSVVVTGQRAALQSAQALKRNSEDIVDGVVAEEAGKLPDKSITEVLQRVVGVTIDRNKSRGDPEHFSVEGSGIQVRGLSWSSSTLNSRESFSAGGAGRQLSWGDVPSELMSAVLVHKNPPAELIEGGVSGQVDLRTALPFDYQGTKRVLTVSDNYTVLGHENSPAVSGLYSTRWSTDSGQWGALLDLSTNRNKTYNDTVQLDPYYPRTDLVAGQTVWVPKSASWRNNINQTDRNGIYAALQWKKNDKQSSLTILNSSYRDIGVEHALFTGVESPYKSQIANPVYDSKGVLVSGTYSYPLGGLGANNFAAGGLGYSDDTGYSTDRSQTRDIAWNFKWDVDDRWSLQNDVQWVHATDSSQSANMTLGTFIPRMSINTNSRSPVRLSFDQQAVDFLANPGNYYLNNIYITRNKGSADMFAWKGDAQYKIDRGVLRDFRFGVRLTDRTSTNVDASASSKPNAIGSWYGIADPWEVKQTSVPGQLPGVNDQLSWQSRGNLGYFSDPRYAALVPTQTFAFKNFFNGKLGPAPSLIVPDMTAVKGYPGTFQNLPQILKLECQDGNTLYGTSNDCSARGSDWKPLIYDGDPAQTNKAHEHTQAVYGTLRFSDDDLRFPTEGNLGLRVVHTSTVVDGYTVFMPPTAPPPDAPTFDPIAAQRTIERSYFNFLPSLNIKTDLTSKLQARLGLSQGMYRAGFGDLQAYQTLNQNFTTTNGIENISYTGDGHKGNPFLKPMRANNFDASLEWYPRNSTSLTADVFYKQVKDIVLDSANVQYFADQAGNLQGFLVSQPDNVAKGSVGGLELGAHTYLDLFENLPQWAKAFGISANYTYIHSAQQLYHPFNLPYCPSASAFNNSNLSLYGCDTNGLPFRSLPIQYLSKNAFNLMFLYDSGPLSARLAYSWRSRFLQGVNVNGTSGKDATSADPARVGVQDVGFGLPTWQEATGQWDAGVDYKVTDKLSFSLSATNLMDIVIRQTQQQHIGNMGRAWFEPGRSFRLSARYDF
jgi:TonB-dependent receptor